MQKDLVSSRIVESAERRKVEWTRRRTEAPEQKSSEPAKPAEPVVVEEEVRLPEESQRRGAKVPYAPTREDIENRRVAARKFTGGASGRGATADSREAQRRAEEAEEEVPILASDAATQWMNLDPLA